MSSFNLTTPVALLVFNRPDTTARVFAAIREARPAQLLIVADGPRAERADDGARCAEVRRIVEQVDWPCKVQHNYAKVNQGCRQRVASGLDWVFDQVVEAIVLEDDCLPDRTFFRFCQELLEYYRNDHRVGMISGDNFQFGHQCTNDSYYFSRYFHIWGWATWRDRWVGSYDVALKQWPEVKNQSWLSAMLNDKAETATWKKKFEKAYCCKIDTWDYQWVFANWLKDRLCILPSVNLISNEGFNSMATHTKVVVHLANLDRHPVTFPLKHPGDVLINRDADQRSLQMCSKFSFVKSLINRLFCRLN
jgi:hypothetical protein